MGFASNNVRFLCLTTALVLVVLMALLWTPTRAPYFDRHDMAFQTGISRTVDPGCRLPGGTDRIHLEYPYIRCSNLQSILGKVFDPADAVNDAKLDLQRGAFRFIGRTDTSRSQIVIPGIECASEGLRNALYDSSCLVMLPPVCKSLPDFDKYAKAYNTAPLNKPPRSSSACK